jgi:serine/threonine protein kinase
MPESSGEGQDPTKDARWRSVKALVEAALDQDPQRRSAFVQRACEGDPELQAEVESLLRAHDSAPGDFLGNPGDLVSDLVGHEPSFLDDRIAGYEIQRRLGCGGMGEVWLAEELQSTRRRVAIKLIKFGMDTREVLARFEAEQQALALMDHDNIAHVYTAGMTERGRPYFVMQYVDGEPITDYCDRKRFSLPTRLELFSRVCHAVHHAHQRGIIHRDLKPSNILVHDGDDGAIPKIIDFGIAKATEQRLGAGALLTKTGMLMGTPEYMSPEQAEMTSLNVDARTDVFALGVVLYELLTGFLPIDYAPPSVSGIDELRRQIRKQRPRTPSVRVERAANADRSAAARSTDRTTLVSDLRGDLDRVVLCALEKDRARRYATPRDFAEDIRRHQQRDAVLAPVGSAVTRRRSVTIALVLFAISGLGFAGWALGLLPAPVASSIAEGRTVMILTDAYSVPYTSDVVDAFRHTGARVTTDDTELTNERAMPASLVSGYDLVVVITVFGTVHGSPIDGVDMDGLESAINSRASRAFILISDACSLCSISSTERLLAVVKSVGGWSTRLGPIEAKRFEADLDSHGVHTAAFGAWSSIIGNNYSPLFFVPDANVIYRGEAGVLAAVVAASANGSCIFMTTDSTPFVAPINGSPPGQADGLAEAYLQSALSPIGPCEVSETP